MADIDNSKLMGLLIIVGGGLLLTQEQIKEERKQRQWIRPSIRKRDSKRAYYSIINDLVDGQRRFWKVPTNEYINILGNLKELKFYMYVFAIFVSRPLHLRFLGSLVKNVHNFYKLSKLCITICKTLYNCI